MKKKLFQFFYFSLEIGRDILPIRTFLFYSGLYLEILPPEINEIIAYYAFTEQEDIQEAMINIFVNENYKSFEKCLKSILAIYKKQHQFWTGESIYISQINNFIKFMPDFSYLSIDQAPLLKHPDVALKYLDSLEQVDLKQAVLRFHKHNRAFLLSSIQQCCSTTLPYMYDQKDDEEIIMTAVKKHGRNYHSASDRLRDKKEIVMQALQSYPFCISDASDRLKNDETVVLAALQSSDYRVFKYASNRIKDDFNCVMKAVAIHGLCLRDSSLRLQNNKVIAFTAIRQDSLAIQYMSKALRDDMEIVNAAFSAHSKITSNFSIWVGPRIQDDKQFVLKMINIDGENLLYSSKRLRDDFDVALTAVKKSGKALEYVSDRLQNNKTIVEAAIKQWPFALGFASPTLRNDKKIVKIAISQNTDAIIRASLRLQQDDDLYF